MKTSNIKLPHSVIVKSPGLLPMLYQVSELAEAIGAVERTLRDWLVLGAPHLRDERGRVWVHGREFAAWVAGMRKQKRNRKLKDNEALCLRCNEIVKMLEPKTYQLRGKLTNTRGKCPQCGCTINRGGRLKSNPEPSDLEIEEKAHG
jgi:hypothetical protein